MKKIALLFAAFGATVAFTACQDSADDHPVLGKTEGQVVDFLNTPENASADLQFTEQNKDERLHLTAAMPTEYGFQAPVTYQVQLSLSEDFETPAVQGCPAEVVLGTSFQNPKAVNPTYEEVARAICKMLNVQSADRIPTPYQHLYVRLISNVTTTTGQPYEGTTLLSNTVVFDRVSVGYLAIVVPGLPTGIYLRGDMNGWGSPAEWEFLTSSESNVYEIADCSIAQGTEFKVADANWDKINYGAGAGTLKFNAPYDLSVGGANIVMPANFSGRVQLSIVSGKYQITFEAAEPDVPGVATGVFIRGDLNGWSADPSCEFLTTDIKNRWEIANISIPAGSFKVADANWGSVNLGANGQPIEIGAAYVLQPGGDNIQLSADFNGSALVTVKKGVYTLTLTPAD